MNLLPLLVILYSCFEQFYCDYDSDCQLRGKQKLDGLVVTWGAANATNPWAFSHLPRTIDEALDQSWKLLDDGCMDSSLQHKGKRYILGDDVTLIIIYDGQGHVAGIQATIPKSSADAVDMVDYKKLEFVYYETIRGQERYVLTMYFVNPDSICSGRSNDEFEADGTLNQAYIWKGTNSYLIPPLTEDISKLTAQKWAKGICFDTMGEHYYYDASLDQKCADVKPYFIVYDCGRLIALELFLIGNFTQDLRYEYLSKDLFKLLIDPLPACLLDAYYGTTNGITELHIFFTREPEKVYCPK